MVTVFIYPVINLTQLVAVTSGNFSKFTPLSFGHPPYQGGHGAAEGGHKAKLWVFLPYA